MEPAGISAALAEVGGDEGLQAALSEELRLLLACPQVRPPATGAKVFFNADHNLPPAQQRPQERGVRFSLLCCKQITKRCNARQGEAACPTWLEAVRFVRSAVQEKHSGEACLERAAAARIAEGLGAPQSAAAAPRSVFQLMAAAQLEQQRARTQSQQLQKDLNVTILEEAKVGQKRALLEEQLAACAATLRLPPKRPRSSSTPCFSSCSHGGSSEAAEELPPWADWSLDTWRRLEAVRQRLRRITLKDRPPLGAKERPRGSKSALEHERRGLVGAVQEWACGSRQEAAMLISRLVERLELKVRLLVVA